MSISDDEDFSFENVLELVDQMFADIRTEEMDLFWDQNFDDLLLFFEDDSSFDDILVLVDQMSVDTEAEKMDPYLDLLEFFGSMDAHGFEGSESLEDLELLISSQQP